MNTSSRPYMFHEIVTTKGDVLNSDQHPVKSSWHRHANKITVKQGDKYKTVYASHSPIKTLTVHIDGLEKKVDVPDGCQVFQSIVAQTTFNGKSHVEQTLGRIIGIIKDGEVIEEYFLDRVSGNTLGYNYKQHVNELSSSSK